MKHSVFKIMLYLLKTLWRYDKKTFFTLSTHIAVGVMMPFVGVLIPSLIINMLLQKVSIFSYMFVIAIMLLLYGILSGTYDYLKSYNAYAFIQIREMVFNKQVILHRANLDYAYLEDEATRKLLEDAITALETNTTGVEGMYHTFIEFAIACLGLLLYATFSSSLHSLLTLALLIIVIIQYVCFIFARNYEFSHKDELNRYTMRTRYLNQLVYDTSAAKDIRLFQLQDWMNDKFISLNRLIAHMKNKEFGAYMAVDVIAIMLDFLRDIACYSFLIYELQQGMSIDQFVFFLGIISGFSLWFKKLGEHYAHLSSEGMLVNRMLKAFELKNVMHHGTGKTITASEIQITFDHVSFRYPNQSEYVLNDVSFTIHANEKMALVGVNGAGKSTIVKLILGLYTPDDGAVCINGIDTRELDVNDIYKHIDGIFQDSMLLSYTIAENVSMQDIDETDLERVRSCLKRAKLWNVVASLQNKEKTFLFKDVNEQGVQFSGGQIQKLFMARLLYHDCPCMLLDEPSAALDAIAESEVYEDYRIFTKNKTSLFISHRLNSTKFCDSILVLDQGQIIEQGTHEELLAKQGVYATMYHVQSKYYTEEGNENEIME